MMGKMDGSAAGFSEGERNIKACGNATLRPISGEIASVHGRELDGVAVDGIVVRGGGLNACQRVALRKSRCSFDEARNLRTEKITWQAIVQDLALLQISSQELIYRPSPATPLLLSSDDDLKIRSDAAIKGNFRDVHTLLKARTSVDRRNEHGCTPLYTALARGDPAVAEALLVAEASMTTKTAAAGATLHCAAYKRGPLTAALVTTDVLKLGASPIVMDSMPRTPLHLTALVQHTQVLSTAYDLWKTTMPLVPPRGEDVVAAMILVNAMKEVVDARHNMTAETALRLMMVKKAVNDLIVHAAVVSGGGDIVLALLTGGTAVIRRNDRNGLALFHVPATRWGHDAVHALPGSGGEGSLDKQGNGRGGSLLHLTSRGCFPEVDEALIHCKASVYRINREDLSLLRMTLCRDLRSCAAILAVRGGRVENIWGSGVLRVDTIEKGLSHMSAVQPCCRAPTSARGWFDVVSLNDGVHRGCSPGPGALANSIDHAGNTSAHVAAGENKPDIVQLLLQYGATVDFRVKAAVASLRATIPRELTEVERAMIAQRGASAIIACLFEAIVSNREDLFHTVLRSGVRLSIPSVEAQQLLQIAAEYDRPHAVEILLGDYGVNPDDTYLSGVSCLYLAAKHGFLNIVRLFLRFKADCKLVDMYGNSALMEGASGGHDAVVHTLLEAGAKLWTANHDGNTALHLAVKRDHSSTVEILVREGNADAHAFNRSGESPLSFAAALGYTKSVISLLEDETLSVCRLESLVLAIYFAAKRGQVDCLKAIIRHGISIDRMTQTGWNSLQRAVRQSDIKTARILLQHGASVTEVYPHGNSIMHYTTDSVLVNCLIGYGAPVNCRNVHNITPLHKASHKGKGETVELLLGGPRRYEVNSKNNNGMTALHYAVKGGHAWVVDALMDAGASSSVADYNGQTSIHMAVELDNVSMLKVLMRYDCHIPNIEDSRGLSPVHLAAQNGHLESLEALLASPIGRGLLDYQSECNGWTPLHVAADVRCFGAVNTLLQAGASMEKVDVLLQTPLHIAAASGDGKLVTLLLDHGASLGAKDDLGQTPLLVAVGCQHVSIVYIMLTEGASSEVTHVNGQTAIHIAVEGGGQFCLEIVQALIAHGAPVTHRDKDGYTPLHIAVMTGQTDVVLAILEARHGDCGISVADNISFYTPLHYAAGLEHPSSRECIVTMLLAHGAPVDARSREGTSPLLRACACEYLTVAQILLNNGASPGTGGEKGFTPLHHACKKGQTEVARLLLDNGAVPGHCWNVLGVSPLHHAAKEGHLEVVKLLLPRLVVRQINLTTKKGRTPLMDAVSKGHCDIVDALLQAGADPNEGGYTQLPPLSIAADSESNTNSILVVQSLLKKGADPGTFCREGYLPLHRACAASGDMQIVKALLNAGTPVTSPCPGEHFHLPLHFAALHGHAQAVWALASVEGCQLDEKEAQYWRTPLTTAIFEGHTETVRALLELGAPLESDITDKTGAMIGSHVHLALLVGHTDICQLLLQAMAFEAQADDAQP